VVTVEVDAHPELGVRNSQPEGIGRVAPLGQSCAWNNLGRNVVFASPKFEPVAVFGTTRFPDDDETSQFDLDVHAILELPGGIVVVLNHLGILRAFCASELSTTAGSLREIEPLWTRTFVGDMERVVAVGSRLVGSRPRETRAPGVLVSEEIPRAAGAEDVATRVQLEEWGPVTALGAVEFGGRPYVAVGSTGRIGLVPVGDRGLGEPCWQRDVAMQPATFQSDGKVLWVAGSGLTPVGDDYDWESLRGGGLTGVDPVDGTTVVDGRFVHDLAWGNGGAAVAIVGDVLCGIGRHGEVYCYRGDDGAFVAATAPLSSHALGIAHAATVGDHLLFGFNRAGYRLYAVAASSVEQLVNAGA
jgi:hypothetical protein